MNDMYLFIVFAASAYVLQAVISWKQLKHFNQTYSELRRKGKSKQCNNGQKYAGNRYDSGSEFSGHFVRKQA